MEVDGQFPVLASLWLRKSYSVSSYGQLDGLYNLFGCGGSEKFFS